MSRMKVSAYWIIYKQNTNIKSSYLLFNKTIIKRQKLSNTPVSFLSGELAVSAKREKRNAVFDVKLRCC